ncbi:MAG: hypothetical protein P1U89_19185 [Verrucomicrobiales bacterium]|nr:hypothetical protein [Verrucomicrobiales bacterium]
MSLRSLFGVFLICAAIIAPWVVSDWFAGDTSSLVETPQHRVTVPGMKPEAREKRNFSVVPAQVKEGSKSKRVIPRGAARNFATSAKALLTPGRAGVPQSDLSVKTAARHTDRITFEMNRLGMQLGDPVFCRLFKEENEFELWVKPSGKSEFSLYKVYRICKRSGDLGPKKAAGDRQTPEGFYYVPASRMVPDLQSHLGFHLGYPNAVDRYHCRTGGDVMVHGNCSSKGTYSMTDESMEEIFTVVSASLNKGQDFFRVHCFPFRMDDKRMDPMIAAHPENDQFWANLKEGYDFFEILRFPPNVTVSSDGKYQFAVK